MRSEKRLENKRKYDIEYAKTHLKRIPLDVTLQEYETIRGAASAAGTPVNTYIKSAIREKIARDNENGNGNAP